MRGAALRRTPDIRSGVRRAQDGEASRQPVCRPSVYKTAALSWLNRHFAVPYRTAGGDAFRRIDDGVGVDAMVAIEIVDRAGLAEMLDAQRFHAVTAHAAEPPQRGRMTIDHGDDAAVTRQGRQQFFDMAEMRHATAVAAQRACRSPS